MLDLESLFKEHLKIRMATTDKALAALNYKSLILGAGEPFGYFADDTYAPFKTNPHFAHWCPAVGPHHVIKYEPGKKPLLIYYSPDDFWHYHAPLGNPFWASCFEIIEVGNKEKIWELLGDTSFSVFLGNETKYAIVKNIKINCELLEARLNWYRRFKSDYEIECLSQANRLGAKAHFAAKEAFFNGDSEYQIHNKYLQAIECVDTDLPYTGIVALDKNSAILHYHGREKRRNGNVLLIDSGASFNNYGSDITRTYANKNCHPAFTELLKQTEDLQQDLCKKVKKGLYFPSLHETCHKEVAKILENIGLISIKGDYDTALNEGLTKVFLPHGLGHKLGIQVHDIGGKQLDEQGNPAPINPPNVLYRSLRFVGTLENNVVVTIEPGIYFIQTLLNQYKEKNKYSENINWALVEKLIPYGGIRIEDDVVPLENSQRNLTREFLP
ncbi:Xaa-Pro dipeptidase [Pigmentibacter sp. JX0631]|uniref:Xaa-Pro dipeptidase n=1 Tax=Pigmentibacter sp. JX0631 TaxID=2976982 RepID=UPI0024690244|nr:Xaa-Pro dipeptidase [Pigmentibacter sp. JX0631]WGL58505.1 Xaa-Pro dipeptidase [Pigmentibacter sp. JX0631]